VPATGAKGLNLAVADVRRLAIAIADWYRTGSAALLDRYSTDCLGRVWRAQDFSNYMSLMLHRLSDDPFAERLQLARLRYVAGSVAASTSLAENYVGLPFD
jgi:p-hydroxybenzoate 3-monooxygenase